MSEDWDEPESTPSASTAAWQPVTDGFFVVVLVSKCYVMMVNEVVV